MINIIRGTLYFVTLCLIQVLVLNNIHFLRLATPLLYVYFIIKLPVGYSPVQTLFLSFLMGIMIDILSNTPGMHVAACTLVGFIRPKMIRLFKRENLPDNIAPSFSSFSYGSFVRFAITLVAIHHLSLFLIESLALFDILYFSIRFIAGVLTTIILIIIVETFHKTPKRGGD
ncbi:MAG: rod shape-determining protein MreD [Tannerellaceae bacterium]|jgi:rod shape-determining protein MreD|nr:rod shape-determining protein MreD [Tannerellaceae bacterium]